MIQMKDFNITKFTNKKSNIQTIFHLLVPTK